MFADLYIEVLHALPDVILARPIDDMTLPIDALTHMLEEIRAIRAAILWLMASFSGFMQNTRSGLGQMLSRTELNLRLASPERMA